jgi:hypothetical protein
MNAITIVMTLFWLYAIGIIGFAVWSGIVVGRARAELAIAVLRSTSENCGAKQIECEMKNPGFIRGL